MRCTVKYLTDRCQDGLTLIVRLLTIKPMAKLAIAGFVIGIVGVVFCVLASNWAAAAWAAAYTISQAAILWRNS